MKSWQTVSAFMIGLISGPCGNKVSTKPYKTNRFVAGKGSARSAHVPHGHGLWSITRRLTWSKADPDI